MKRITAQVLESAGIAHGFFGRDGGVSSGLYESLNCGPGSQDDPQAVRQNRSLVAAALAPDSATSLVSLSQVHSAVVHTLAAPPAEGAPRLEGDGMVTATRGLALGILTADCAPVLLADPQAQVIGAAHAGWKARLERTAMACWRPCWTPWQSLARHGIAPRRLLGLAFPRSITKSPGISAIASWNRACDIGAFSRHRTGKAIIASIFQAMLSTA